MPDGRKISSRELVRHEGIQERILLLRGQRVMLDAHLAQLYGVTTFNLNKAVKRNLDRFPPDFMFQLTAEEYRALRFHFGILERGAHAKYLPHVFTEQGVAMLSSVLRSDRAVKVNVEIMRAFVRLRQILATHADLARKVDALEKKYDQQFKVVFDAIRALMKEPTKKKKAIGFGVKEKGTRYQTRQARPGRKER